MTQTAIQQGSAAIPEAKNTIEPTSKDKIDEALAILQDNKVRWVSLSVGERIELLEELVRSTAAAAQSWVDAAIKAKRLIRGSAQEGEEWLAGPAVVINNIQLLIRSLEDIEEQGHPSLPKKAYAKPGGQVVAPVFPTTLYDSLLFTSFSAEVWMDPEVRLEDLPKTQATFYQQKNQKGKVALVLGAGNVSSIGPMDALYKLIAEGQVVVLKTNPVNEYLGPIFEEAFSPLIDRGFFQIVYGGATEGEYLCQHDLVDEIHITGSDKTHDAIVYGVGDEGARRKAESNPRNTKRISSELGNVSPIIVVPGPWSASDLSFHGTNLASSLCNNAGFNCNATRVIVQHEGWSLREALLDATKRAFEDAPARYPYYPGAEDRHQMFVLEHPEAAEFGEKGENRVPWTIISHLDPNKTDDICFTRESWCGVTSEVGLSAKSVVDYIDKAVEFCNESVWGTLSASIIVHPKSLKDPAVATALDRAIANLRYGAVTVNHWSALAYALVTPTWGAFPGHPDEDIRSGRGVVHNTFLFDRPQKSVIRGPFRVMPKPTWFVNNRTSGAIAKKLTYFYADPSVARLPSIFASALRG